MILKAYNKNVIEGQNSSTLTANAASGSGSITVANYSGFSDNDYLLIGSFGEPTAEIVQVDDASIDATVTLQANTVYDHYVDTPVTVVPFNKVQFFRSTTDVDANTDDSTLTQLNSDIAIQAYRDYTIYEDTANNTGYGYVRFKNDEETVYSEYSESLSYSGRVYNTVEEILKDAYTSLGLKLGDKYVEYDTLMIDINEAQNKIKDYNDWTFELIKNDTSLAVTENENKYALSGLTYSLKYPDTYQGILNVRLGSTLLDYIDPDEMDENFEGTVKTEVKTAITASDTSIVLDDTYELTEAGTVYIGEDVITYTGNTETTGTLTGCTGVDNDHDVDETVWQGLNPGKPTKYTIFDGYISLDKPVDTNYVGYKLKFKYLKELSRLTDMGDVVEIPFYSALSNYVKYKIESRRRNFDIANMYLQEFTGCVAINLEKYKLPILEEYNYYNF